MNFNATSTWRNGIRRSVEVNAGGGSTSERTSAAGPGKAMGRKAEPYVGSNPTVLTFLKITTGGL